MGLITDFFLKETKSPIEAVGTVIDKLFTSDEERLQKKVILERLALQPDLLQGEIDKIEAANASLFVSGWRPAVGWVCAFSLFFTFIFNPILSWYTGHPGPSLPTEFLSTLLYSLLGLGALRTGEKISGVSK